MAIIDLGWIAWRDAKEQEMPQAWDSKLRLGLAQEAFKAGRAAEKDRAKLNGAAAPEGAQAVAYRWLDDLRDRMEHCVSAADEGEDYAVPRDVLDAMTTLGLMEKVARGKWAPTDAGRKFTRKEPTLPVEIYGKHYEVPIAVQLHIVQLRGKIATPPSLDAEDAARFSWYFTGDRSDAQSLIDVMLRVINGSQPTLDEWRNAIDAARAAGGE